MNLCTDCKHKVFEWFKGNMCYSGCFKIDYVDGGLVKVNEPVKCSIKRFKDTCPDFEEVKFYNTDAGSYDY